METALNPEAAAQWMAAEVRQRGLLSQREAALYLSRYRDPRLAYHDDEDRLCVGRWVLRRLRTRYPALRYDRRLKCWREA